MPAFDASDKQKYEISRLHLAGNGVSVLTRGPARAKRRFGQFVVHAQVTVVQNCC